MSEPKIEYRFIQERTPQQYEHTVEKLLNEGFLLRGQSFRFSEFICGEFVKYPEVSVFSSRPGYGTIVRQPGPIPTMPMGADFDPFNIPGVEPEGQEIVKRFLKCYNNPKFRELLSDIAKDFLPEDENTAMTDSELERMIGKDSPMGRITRFPKENPDE